MATIGLDKLYYAKITENEDGEETYGVPAPLAKAMKPTSYRTGRAVLYADDGAAEVIGFQVRQADARRGRIGVTPHRT